MPPGAQELDFLVTLSALMEHVIPPFPSSGFCQSTFIQMLVFDSISLLFAGFTKEELENIRNAVPEEMMLDLRDCVQKGRDLDIKDDLGATAVSWHLCAFIYFFVPSFISLCLHLFLYRFICFFIDSFIFVCLHLFISSCICVFLYIFIYLFLFRLIYFFMHSFIYFSMHLFRYAFVYFYLYSFVSLYINLFLYRCTLLQQMATKKLSNISLIMEQ